MKGEKETLLELEQYIKDNIYDNLERKITGLTLLDILIRMLDWVDLYKEDKDVYYQISATGVKGTVSGTGLFQSGQICTLTFHPDHGYTFAGWYEDGVPVSLDVSYTFVVNGDRTLVAYSTELQKYVVHLEVNDLSLGIVSGDGEYYVGDTCQINATPKNGCRFVNWVEGSDVLTTEPLFSFVVDKDHLITANFATVPTYTITCNPSLHGGVTTNVQSAPAGTTITITVVVASGYTLSSLSVVDASNNPIPVSNGRFTMPSSNVTITATFELAIPDYYVGFCDYGTTFEGYTDNELFANAQHYSTVAEKPLYPSPTEYVYFGQDQYTMYLLYNADYDVKIDVKNPSAFDINNASPAEIDIFHHGLVYKDGKTYNVIGTYDRNNSPANGYRFKFESI